MALHCFNPHPGWLPGETRQCPSAKTVSPVSIRTRVGYRVRLPRSRTQPAGESSFNPHPGWLPGETRTSRDGALALASFNPHPGWLPGETGGGAIQAARQVFQSAPGLVTG